MSEPIIGKCRYCKKTIYSGITIRPNGDTFHDECAEQIEKNLKHWHDTIDSAEKITALHTTLNVEQMREDGILLLLEDFTVDAFKQLLIDRAISMNATSSTASIEVNPTKFTLSCEAVRKNDKTTDFTFKFKGIYHLLWSAYGPTYKVKPTTRWIHRFTATRFFKAVYYYWTDRKFRNEALETAMAIIWKHMPDDKKMAERSKPL